MIANLVLVRGVEPQHSGDQPRESRLIRLLVRFGSCKTLTDRLQTDCLTERNLERESRIRTCPVIVADDQSATVQPLWLPRNKDGLHTRLCISSARLKGDQCLLVRYTAWLQRLLCLV